MITYADEASIQGRYHGYTHELNERFLKIEYPKLADERLGTNRQTTTF
jgi:hypothetical protein